jgi:hypothetical protein
VSMPMATAPARPPWSAAALMGAVVALIVRIAVCCLPFRSVASATRVVARTTTRPAVHEEIVAALTAVDAGARLLPVRVACLERSLTAVVLLAARRRGVQWCVGVRTPPLAAHAWLLDNEGQPVGEPSTTAAYRPLLIVPVSTATLRSDP